MKKVIIGLFLLHFVLITISVFENVHLFDPSWNLGIAKRYTTPFFEQNWGMFSNPPQTTKRVYFQFHTPIADGDSIQVSDWYDVNSSMYAYNDQHLFSVAQRLIKYESGCLNSVFQSIRNCKDETPDICIEYSPGFIALRNYAKIIYKNAGYPPARTSAPPRRFVIKVVEEFFPPFEDRHQDYFDKSNYEYAVHTTKAYELI